jgi:hypothetical protein
MEFSSRKKALLRPGNISGTRTPAPKVQAAITPSL